MLREHSNARVAFSWILAGTLVFAWDSVARADLTLTAAGTTQGLSLTLFANNFPTSGSVGPLGIAFPSNGGVLVSDQSGNVRRFSTDTDGQSAASAPVGQNYGSGSSEGLARLGNTIYMAGNGGQVVQLNNDGTFNQTIVSNIPNPVGLTANPVNGHLYVSTRGSGGIIEVNPSAKTQSAFVSNIGNPDGLSVSPDGKTLYVAETSSGHILGYDTTSKALVFDSGAIAGGIDGTAAGTGQFSNFVFANVNNGTVVEVNLTTLSQTVIANNGTRGDFVAVDASNNTLLLTQSSQVFRLNGASFTAVPEPGSFVLGGVGSLCVLGYGRWRRRRSA